MSFGVAGMGVGVEDLQAPSSEFFGCERTFLQYKTSSRR